MLKAPALSGADHANEHDCNNEDDESKHNYGARLHLETPDNVNGDPTRRYYRAMEHFRKCPINDRVNSAGGEPCSRVASQKKQRGISCGARSGGRGDPLPASGNKRYFNLRVVGCSAAPRMRFRKEIEVDHQAVRHSAAARLPIPAHS